MVLRQRDVLPAPLAGGGNQSFQGLAGLDSWWGVQLEVLVTTVVSWRELFLLASTLQK